jgi:glycine betaine/proline transport system permease protein
MVCFSMAVISAFIAAKGLGYNLLLALNRLDIGLALEAGLCISLIAILLDKMSLAWANKQTDYFGNLTFFQKNKNILFFVASVIVGIILAYVGTFLFKGTYNYLFEIPHNKGISTADFWNKGVDWIFDTFFVYIKAFNTWLIVDVLQPMRALYLRMPAIATLVLVVGAGYIIGGIRSALVVCGLTLFIALSPWWDRALVTTYMATFGVVISCIIGFTVGTLCFQNKHTTSFMLSVCDIFQTFPSFVYLIPVMMLFGITDTSVLIAVIVYATIPATRYTIEGLRSVPVALHDAATMSGVTKFQRLFKIEFPLAFPHMMLGLNQTIVFALFMVIIGAFIGTEDLGQYILKALSDKNGAGIGLTLGLCVAFIGLIFDNLIRTWVNQRKKHLGID